MTSFDAYRAVKAVNASSLKTLIVDRDESVYSPAAYQYGLANPRPDTASFSKGRAFHCATLEPRAFPTRYLVYDGTRRGKPWSDFQEAAPDGSEILTRAEYDEVVEMAEAVLANPRAAALLAAGTTEQTLTWTDEETGLPCKCRADHIDGRIVTDLKSTADIRTRALTQSIYYYAYDLQAAHYCAGVRSVFGVEPEFWFVFCNKAAPFHVRVKPLHEDGLYAGEELRRTLLRIIADCTASGDWPEAYQDDDDPIDLPAFYYAQAESIMEATL